MKWGIMLIFLLVVPISQALVINEIMYNPEGNDNNREWIEVYNEENNVLDLTGWRFYEDETHHRLTLTQGANSSVLPYEYFVIVQDTETFLQDYPNYSNKIIDSSFLLSNTGELLIIENSTQETFDSIIDIFYYSFQQGGDGDGMSLCKIDELWQNCIPTPGFENLNELDYSSIKITEFLPDPIGADADSEWIELFNSGEYALNLENSSIYDNIGVEADIFIADSNTLNNTIIYPKEFLVVYTIGRDSLLNNDGFEKIRLYKDDYLIDEVSYSGSKEGLSWSKVDSRWILTYPTPNEPNEIESPKNSSHLEIETVYLGSDNKSKFGDQIRVRINVYKGDTTKYNLDMYIKDKEQVSKRSEINLYESFKNYVLTIPIQIEPNCNQKYPDGTYTIYLTGLDKTATEEIEIEGINGDLCKVITETVTVSSVSQKESSNDDFFSTENQEVIEDNEITGEVAYTSSDVKSKNTGIYFFAGALLIVIIYLIVKKTL